MNFNNSLAILYVYVNFLTPNDQISYICMDHSIKGQNVVFFNS